MTRSAAPPIQPADSEGLRQVPRFEYNLLRILHFLVKGDYPADLGMQLVRTAIPRPECLSGDSVGLVKDTLAKACVKLLVKEGGWRKDRYLRGGIPVGGRVWERIPLDERSLVFSRAVLEFLIWATAEKVFDTKSAWDAAPQALTPADELFFWLAFDAIRIDPDLLPALKRKESFRRNLLCWISFPGDMVDGDEVVVPNLSPLFEGQRAVFLESLQPHLEHRWLRSERMKGQVGDWKKMRQQGRAEFAALQAFLTAAEKANRADLSRFVLRVNAALFAADMMPVFWTGGLQGSGPPRLADRLDTQRSALAVPRQMETLEGWQERARSVGFFDSDYQATQLWKADWEACGGDHIAERARATIEMLEPLRGPGSGGQSAANKSSQGGNQEGSPGT